MYVHCVCVFMQVCVGVSTRASMCNTYSLCVFACVNACVSLHNIQSLVCMSVCVHKGMYMYTIHIHHFCVCACVSMHVCVIYTHCVYCACLNLCIHVQCLRPAKCMPVHVCIMTGFWLYRSEGSRFSTLFMSFFPRVLNSGTQRFYLLQNRMACPPPAPGFRLSHSSTFCPIMLLLLLYVSVHMSPFVPCSRLQAPPVEGHHPLHELTAQSQCPVQLVRC